MRALWIPWYVQWGMNFRLYLVILHSAIKLENIKLLLFFIIDLCSRTKDREEALNAPGKATHSQLSKTRLCYAYIVRALIKAKFEPRT
jgi:hypothetical protein